MTPEERKTLSWFGWMLYIIVGGVYINLVVFNKVIVLFYFISASLLGGFSYGMGSKKEVVRSDVV